jgi:hypothetical protein
MYSLAEISYWIGISFLYEIGSVKECKYYDDAFEYNAGKQKYHKNQY